MSDPMVTTDWLAERLGRPGVAVLDATWRMPADRADPKADFLAAHIPGALFFDIDAVSDHDTDLPHMAPTPAAFEQAVGRLGISNEDTVVVYDQLGLFSAARAWWMFRLFGHEQVYVLDGGLPVWRAGGRPLETGEEAGDTARFVASPNPRLVSDWRAVAAELERGGQVADARSAPRFEGVEAEPRAGLTAGHMPGARNLPFRSLIDDSGRLKDEAGLRRAFADAGVDPAKPLIATCGSGLTAAIIALARQRLEGEPAAVYDGSWSEWGGRPDLPVATGPA